MNAVGGRPQSPPPAATTPPTPTTTPDVQKEMRLQLKHMGLHHQGKMVRVWVRVCVGGGGGLKHMGLQHRGRMAGAWVWARARVCECESTVSSSASVCAVPRHAPTTRAAHPLPQPQPSGSSLRASRTRCGRATAARPTSPTPFRRARVVERVMPIRRRMSLLCRISRRWPRWVGGGWRVCSRASYSAPPSEHEAGLEA